MRQLNPRLTVVVAAVAVAAVVIGGVVASRQSPRSIDSDAAPLGGSPSSPAPSVAPSPAPSATPSGAKPPAKPTGTPTSAPVSTPESTPVTKTPGQTGQAVVPLTLDKLGEGRTPQLAHVVGRELRGGPGAALKIPGTGTIVEAVRVGDTALALQDGQGSLKLVRGGYVGDSTEVPDVTTLVASPDGRAAAYASQRQSSTGEQLKGGVVYAEDTSSPVRKLPLPDALDLEVLAYAANRVFYSAKSSARGTAKLYAWTPGRSSASLVKGVLDPTAVSADGRLAASIEAWSNSGTCSFVVEIATGKKLWRACDHMVLGFTPDKSSVIAGPTYADGYAPLSTWILDGSTGAVRREWTGLAFKRVRAEDDEHLLMQVDEGPETKGAIVRCAISTGECERATPLTSGQLKLGG
ncbi:hypothetical protein Kfla_0616 [Kribbella flavida DSM 17836]|uniref:Uncharacterized protein n=1 Tax=Kribbella flavida (strain DSM 17836 / JCM 10339 / NBRC 14399) TaxID=479435 RepID=D2PX89_KRIFD|nr:hypothetical protein [Kribbella flavida]ADB29737.1 hypothetical protein Kfla_0616 [Kribbella flavida DSM 17836]